MPLLLERAIEPLTDGLVATFLFILAANVGSFLNVVVHRWPRGESVVRGGSCCPACGSAIRWYDNVPVLGWLWLRGRCRDCRSPISPRYPLVEAACAFLLGSLASVELLTGGSNLPGGHVGGGRWGGDSLLLHTDWLLVATCLLHCFLLATVLAWAVLDFEGKGVPPSWVATSTLAVFVAATLLPAMLPVGAGFPVDAHVSVGDWPPPEAAWRGGLASLAGIAAGCVLGVAFGNRTVRSGLVLCAAGLGWQAAVTIMALTVVAAAVRQMTQMLVAGRLQRVRAVATDLVVAVALQMLLWKPTHHFWVVLSQALAGAL
jgi:prepilin signal peptidase PulO-like enzyme (type II secretory pathway)